MYQKKLNISGFHKPSPNPAKQVLQACRMSKLVRPEAFINWFVWGMLQHASFNGENIIDIDHQRNSKSLEFNPARTFSEAQTFCRPALLLSIVCVHLPQCPLVLRAKIGCCLLTGIRLCTCSDNSSCFDY